MLAPGVTHERKPIFNAGRPVVLHVVRTPPPSDLYRLRPVRAKGSDRRQTVPAMQRRLSRRATPVGVNGDYFSFGTGHISGLFLRDGALSARPNRSRPAVTLGPDGHLLMDFFRFRGRWRGGGDRHRIRELNKPVKSPGVGLFTRFWGAATPRARKAVEVVLAGVRKPRLDAEVTGTVVAVERGGRTPIPKGGAVLQARGFERRALLAEASIGTTVTIRLRLPDLPAGTRDGIGGGPLLVRDGRVVRQAGQGFSPDGYAVRHPRTAVGQQPNGRLLFAVADGRSRSSYGLRTRALAKIMAGLGAVNAMALDGGGSSTIAFDGRVLNTPSDGTPRRVATGLFLHYYGIYAPASQGILSPNGDGVGDRKALAAKIVRRSEVRLRMLRPNGSVAWRRTGVVRPGWITRVASSPSMAEGRWRWVVRATDTVTGRETRMTRAFHVNKTLGHLRLDRERMRVTRRRGGSLGIAVSLTRPSRLGVVVLASDGRLRRTLFRGSLQPGRHSWRWNGRTGSGRVVRSGRFTIRVFARNALGAVELRRSVRVLRVSPG